MRYEEFLESKKIISKPVGFKAGELNPLLFDFQADITRWGTQKGRAAVFAGTGLGKTFVELVWSDQVHKQTGGNVLILAPLAVSQQTVREGQKFGIKVNLCRTQADVKPGINITNYEMLEHFDASEFVGIVPDESSILKALDGKTRALLIETFANTPYKLACTATPAPNDYMELGGHAEFLGICKHTEMLSMFFVHDGGDTSKWRLKGHAVKAFWEWVASWAVMLTKPSDLGYDDSKFELPPLRMHQEVVKAESPTEGHLFSIEAQTLQERLAARRSTIGERVAKVGDIVTGDEKWLIWCNLNAEQDELAKLFKGRCVSIDGQTPDDKKIQMEKEWREGNVPILITKPKIFSFGMNWQHCSKEVFVGLSDSFEQVYQAIRRCWRFGQENPVDIYFVTAETEGAVVRNIERKEKEFNEMLQGMISATQEITRKNLRGTERETDEYNPAVEMKLPEWLKGEVA